MSVFDVLTIVGGLCLFLFGMSIMGDGLERRAGFIWADLLNDIERTSDHCSNIAVSIMDAHAHNMNVHQSLRSLKKNNPAFFEKRDDYYRKYRLPMMKPSKQHCRNPVVLFLPYLYCDRSIIE